MLIRGKIVLTINQKLGGQTEISEEKPSLLKEKRKESGVSIHLVSKEEVVDRIPHDVGMLEIHVFHGTVRKTEIET